MITDYPETTFFRDALSEEISRHKEEQAALKAVEIELAKQDVIRDIKDDKKELSERERGYIEQFYLHQYGGVPHHTYGGVITSISEPEESKTSSLTGHLTDTRKQSHGKIQDVGEVSQKLKAITRTSKNWEVMSNSQREALDLIVHKMARILVGDPDFKDHWDDIAGYASIANGQ